MFGSSTHIGAFGRQLGQARRNGGKLTGVVRDTYLMDLMDGKGYGI